MNILLPDEFYMKKALEEAHQAFEEDEVPVGCVIVYKNMIIAKSYNQTEKLFDPTAHAEMIAITQATSFLKSKFLIDCVVYVTLEPCSMCAGALVLARVKRLVFGCCDPKTGACGSVFEIIGSQNTKLNHEIEVKKGVLEKECSALLQEFFRKKRIQN